MNYTGRTYKVCVMCHPKVYNIVQCTVQEDTEDIEANFDIVFIDCVYIFNALVNTDTFVSDGYDSDETFVSNEIVQHLGDDSDATFVNNATDNQDLGNEGDVTFESAPPFANDSGDDSDATFEHYLHSESNAPHITSATNGMEHVNEDSNITFPNSFCNDTGYDGDDDGDDDGYL